MMKIQHYLILIVSALFLMLMVTGFSQPEFQKKSQVINLVKSAQNYVKENGVISALKEFNTPKGQFNQGEQYVYAYNYKGDKPGYCVANGFKPSRVGQNFIDDEDPITKTKIMQQLIELAKKGGGWLTGHFENPATHRVEVKSFYILPVPDQDFFVGSGYYSGIPPKFSLLSNDNSDVSAAESSVTSENVSKDNNSST